MSDNTEQTTGVIVALAEFDKNDRTIGTWPVCRFACDDVTEGMATGRGAFFRPIQAPDTYRRIAATLRLLADECEKAAVKAVTEGDGQ